jgi:thioredoxin 1
MKRLFLTLSLFLFCLPLFAVEFFNGTYEQALQKAKTENKKVLLYFTASWCGPCHYMDQYIFPDQELSTYTAQHYIALKIDADTEAGKKLRIKYNNKGLPDFYIINTNEEILKRKLGAMKLSQLRSFVDEPNAQLSQTADPAVNVDQQILGKAKADSLVNADYQKILDHKPGVFEKFYFTAMVSKWKPGLKMGFNVSNLEGPGTTSRSVAGYYFGLFYDYTYKHFLFQPGLLLNSRGGTFLGATTRLNYLELPLLLSYKITKNKLFGSRQAIRLNLTPYGALNLWTTQNSGKAGLPVQHLPAFKRFDYGAKLGLSFQMGSFEPALGYDFGLANISEITAYKVSNRSYYLSFAVIIGK